MSLSFSLNVLAAVAHPDDIEYNFAGTLLLLKELGCEIHLWNLANGCYGSVSFSPGKTAAMRKKEAMSSAALCGAIYHQPLFDDLAIFYNQNSVASVASRIRLIKPQIILTHFPLDYMEDHQNVARLIATAAFSRGMPYYVTTPPREEYQDPVRIYHALPHGLCDALGNQVHPDFIVNIDNVFSIKKQMLNCHKSQKDWLELSQGEGAFIQEMEDRSKVVAGLSNLENMKYAEGWCRHSTLGYCHKNFDPLSELLNTYIEETKVQTYVTTSK